MEKLCGSVGLSLVFVYLAAWSIYVLGPNSQGPAFAAVSGVCAVAGAIAWRDATRLFRQPRIRRVMFGYVFLVVWTFVILTMIRTYTGALWSGDWLEHFQRSLFFLQRFPTTTELLGGYQLPSRPPMMNVLAAFFLGQTQDRFELFQLVFALLNLLPLLACALVMPALAGPRLTRILPLAALFAMSPAVMHAAAYTWTKALTAFFVVTALWFYQAGWRKNDTVRMTAGFLALSAGLLVHYSAGPYCVFLGLHYLVVIFRGRRARWKELAMIGVACTLLLASWFGWSTARYGLRTTLASNTSVAWAHEYAGSPLAKIAGNIFDSVVPPQLRQDPLLRGFDQRNQAAVIRDHAFVIYQQNLVFATGVAGGPLALWFLLKAPGGKRFKRERAFWLTCVAFVAPAGIAVVGERGTLGVAHLTLLPVLMLGLTVVAAMFSRRRAIAALVLAGCAVDFSTGVMLQARVENLENTSKQTAFPDWDPRYGLNFDTPGALSATAWKNWYQKHEYALLAKWSKTVGPGDTQSRFQQGMQKNETLFQGWFSRNGGSVTFLGDHFGAAIPSAAVLLLLWSGVMWTMWRSMPRPALLPGPASKSPPPKTHRKRVTASARRGGPR